MGRTSVDQQEEIRKRFLEKLSKEEERILMRVVLRIKGKTKDKFISDLRSGQISINKHANHIFKTYYDAKT